MFPLDVLGQKFVKSEGCTDIWFGSREARGD